MDATDADDGIKKGIRKSTGGERSSFSYRGKRRRSGHHTRNGSRFSVGPGHLNNEITEILNDDSPMKG